ncbi:AraC family transcriptional regulator [Metabacillus litoralis]|jgi:AraC family transcriptional regulator|uniref:AraC family transcriptional regulator n=1 Tax=Metabacillus litoralis TaxID=152268 RepID=UPI00203A47DC|nr:AraC family transcriptional regulator [Metabacillus litoralis]MCM3654397.1 AraC family transcriptional regulator [Metabacillus litoralis]
MRISEKGVLDQSKIFFHIPSEFAKKALYCLHDSGLFYCNDKYFVERDNYNNYLIMLIRKGSMTIRYGNQEFQAPKNTLVFLNCHQPHMYQANENVFFEWFHFSGISSQQYFDLLFEKNGCIFSIGNNFVISECMSQIVQMAEKANVNEHFISMNIHKIMYGLNEITHETTDIQEKVIKQAMAYIESHFNEEIKLKDLAYYVNLTPFHFSRVFKKYTGYSPYEYIINYRINYAKTLLQNTTTSIKEISIESGFNNDTHFMTTFKKHTNLTPKQFREIQF